MLQEVMPGDEPQETVYGTPAAEDDVGMDMVGGGGGGGGMGQAWVTCMTDPSGQVWV
jgi:hypothetical protein